MRIPVFVSTPTALSPAQQSAKGIVTKELESVGLEARTLGVTDYPTVLPLREVLSVCRHCAGAVILGFEQTRADTGVVKPGTSEEQTINKSLSFPTPWNHLEAGILFGLGLPMLVFREKQITGGVFEYGATGAFVYDMPNIPMSTKQKAAFAAIVMKWQAKVRDHYYQ